MTTDCAGEPVKFNFPQGEPTPEERRHVERLWFYLQEIEKLLPQDSRYALVCAWQLESGAMSGEVIGTMSCIEVAQVAVATAMNTGRAGK